MILWIVWWLIITTVFAGVVLVHAAYLTRSSQMVSTEDTATERGNEEQA